MKNRYVSLLLLCELVCPTVKSLGAAQSHQTEHAQLPLIFSYGFGDNKEHFYQKMGVPLCGSIQRDTKPILFDYDDASVKRSKAGWFSFWNVPISHFWHTNFGQAPSSIKLLKELITTVENGHNAAGLITHSCGSSAATGFLDRLAQPEKYINDWRKLGLVTATGDLDLARINKLNQAVKQGFLLFIHPLLDIQQSFETIAQKKLWFLPGFISRKIGAATLYLSSLFNNYQPGAPKPIEQLQELHEKNLLDNYHSLVLLAKSDSTVGNKHDPAIKALQSPSFNVAQETDSCGHNAHFSLSPQEQITAQKYITQHVQECLQTLAQAPVSQTQSQQPIMSAQEEERNWWGTVRNTVTERPVKMALLGAVTITIGTIGCYLFYQFVFPKIKAAYKSILRKTKRGIFS